MQNGTNLLAKMQTLEKASGGSDHLEAQQAAPEIRKLIPSPQSTGHSRDLEIAKTRNSIRPALAEQNL